MTAPPVPNPQDKKKPNGFVEVVWEDKTVLILLVLILIFLVWYLPYMTRGVPNTEYITKKDPFTNVTTTETIIHYSPNDVVPLKGVSQGIGFMSGLAVFVLVYYILMKLNAGRVLINMRDAWEKIVYRELKYADSANYPEFEHAEEIRFTGAYLQQVAVGSQEELHPFLWHIGFSFTKESVEYYYVAQVHPYTGHIYGFLKRDEPLRSEDTCPNCGKNQFTTVRVKLPSDVGRLYRNLKGGDVRR